MYGITDATETGTFSVINLDTGESVCRFLGHAEATRIAKEKNALQDAEADYCWLLQHDGSEAELIEARTDMILARRQLMSEKG
jgi:hypothetical protein